MENKEKLPNGGSDARLQDDTKNGQGIMENAMRDDVIPQLEKEVFPRLQEEMGALETRVKKWELNRDRATEARGYRAAGVFRRPNVNGAAYRGPVITIRLPEGLVTTSSVATTIAAVTAKAATTRTGGTVFLTRTRFIHGDAAAAHIGLVELFNRGLCARVFHFNKGKTLGLSGHAIGDDIDRRHFAKLCEGIAQFILSGLEGKIAYINVFHTNNSSPDASPELYNKRNWPQGPAKP